MVSKLPISHQVERGRLLGPSRRLAVLRGIAVSRVQSSASSHATACKLFWRFLEAVCSHDQPSDRGPESKRRIPLLPAEPNKPDGDLFRPGVVRGENEARQLVARTDQARADAMFLEIGAHAPVGGSSTEDLEGQENEERQKEPGEHAKTNKALTDGEMVHKCRLQRRVIVRIQTGQAQPVRQRAAIRDPQPNRLNSSARQRYAEELAPLSRYVQDRLARTNKLAVA